MEDPHLNKKKVRGSVFGRMVGRSDGRTVGRLDRGKVRGSFFWSDGPTVGRSDGGRRTDGSFYFALESPS